MTSRSDGARQEPCPGREHSTHADPCMSHCSAVAHTGAAVQAAPQPRQLSALGRIIARLEQAAGVSFISTPQTGCGALVLFWIAVVGPMHISMAAGICRVDAMRWLCSCAVGDEACERRTEDVGINS